MKKIIEKLKQVDKIMLLRTILQIAAYVNQFIALLGYNTFASNAVYQWLSFGLTIAITALTYWKNNNWSNFAILLGDIFKMFEDGKITMDEVKEFVDKHKEKDKIDKKIRRQQKL